MNSDLEEARIALNKWKTLRKNRITPPSKNNVCKPIFELEYYREAVFYRLLELAEATFTLYDAGNYLGAVVISRSLQETFAVLWSLNKICEYVIKNKELTRFTEKLSRLMLGRKNDSELPQPLQILDSIDDVDKKIPNYRKMYDILSEYVHPNWSGTMGLFAKTGGEQLKVDFARYIKGEDSIITHIEITLSVTMDLLKLSQDSYDNLLNQVLDVCSELHDKGELTKQIRWSQQM